MGFWQPVANLRDYVSQNPPGVTFFVCLLTLALSFICLSYYGHTHTLPNPDSTKDWNYMLSSLSQLQLCMKANITSVDLGSPVTSPLQTVQDTSVDLGSPVTSPLQTVQDTGGMPSVNSSKGPVTHLHLKVPLAVTYSSASRPGVGIHTTLMASQLGLIGNETVNVTLQLLSQPEGGDTYTCLSISAPTHLLPLTPLPPECPVNERIVSPVHVISVEGSHPSPTASRDCYRLQSKHDPTLTAMLTQEQQGVAGRHLFEVSACLIGVCVMLCLSASLTHSLARRYYGNVLDPHREPLINS